MPRYARGSTLDLDVYEYLLENDGKASMKRNVCKRTGIYHSKDKSHCGVPKTRCIDDLHFAFYLSPVIDQDSKSKTRNQVVIHSERSNVFSPKCCTKQIYSEGFNLGIKNARNDRPKLECFQHKLQM
ncbi:uncharacterized protein K460DRAFT_401474 [Cucurbitaria berberidis CBS 394.84]|uniref:Uncharacterized protein n=1 Tax=Cucurbitaria berberidis CBS 394.84 TaxID=1168544 RepID=A0A9P4LD43_9PLEO|nr:uncharacterized protein K460DRAFT_401474 [Cucurbitaria berberidis CBS 394.84]KAF1851451.1 hypothetical protein K460DRAFT_401474 [Cucurbitaria berberidis CBS 394.84]